MNTDAYKFSHHAFYPKNLTRMYSYFTSRSNVDITFFGLSPLLTRLSQPITQADIYEAEAFCNSGIGPNMFNRKGWEHILNQHGGHLPVSIYAVEETSVVETSVHEQVPMIVVFNTDPKVSWVTNYMESLLSHVWYPCTVATRSKEILDIIKKNLQLSGSPDTAKYRLVDFGLRGVSSLETAQVGGAAHLLYFNATDNMPAVKFLKDEYGLDVSNFTVPATEHSVMTIQGEQGEMEVMQRVLDACPTGIVSVVIDSYNPIRFIEQVAEKFKERINREGFQLVFRPDSGIPEESVLSVTKLLARLFGSETNEKGYEKLNPHVAVLQGDGISKDTIQPIYDALHENKFSADNVLFGSGGGLLQKVNRDTYKFAFKACAAIYDEQFDKPFPVFKNANGKQSYSGLLYSDDGRRRVLSKFPDGQIKLGDMSRVFHRVKLT